MSFLSGCALSHCLESLYPLTQLARRDGMTEQSEQELRTFLGDAPPDEHMIRSWTRLAALWERRQAVFTPWEFLFVRTLHCRGSGAGDPEIRYPKPLLSTRPGEAGRLVYTMMEWPECLKNRRLFQAADADFVRRVGDAGRVSFCAAAKDLPGLISQSMKPPLGAAPWPVTGVALLGTDHNSGPPPDATSRSTQNVREAQLAILLAISLLGRIQGAKRVCILTPYKAQQALLDSLLTDPREVLGLSGMDSASRKEALSFLA